MRGAQVAQMLAVVGALALAVLQPAALWAPPAYAGPACVTNDDCDDADPCTGPEQCHSGVCGDGFILPAFPVDWLGQDAYSAPMISVMDHTGPFYQRCCDTQITAYTGESAERGVVNELCPAEPDFPACFLNTLCICGYYSADGSSYVVNGNYEGALSNPSVLSYASHAGYDYRYQAGTPLVATADGSLCKAQEDPINGHFGASSGWEKFHTFYIDHGVVGDHGYASWYLHAADLAGTDTGGNPLTDLLVGQCAPVVAGQQVGTVGNFGTFAPHLHFEVRRHPPAGSPESSAANVIDPYGWLGDKGADPWNDPAENFQAEGNAMALWLGCGNGRLDCGEQCDDGNRTNGDCCAADCTVEAAATSCALEGSLCAVGECDGAGECTGIVVPRADCREPLASGKAQFSFRDRSPDTLDRLDFRWVGEQTDAADYGDPTVSDSLRLCVFDTSGAPAIVFEAEIPAGDICANSKDCWRAKGNPPGAKGYLYKDKLLTPHGVSQLRLGVGIDAKAKLKLKADGKALTLPVLPPLPTALPVEVQLHSDSGICWSASFSGVGVRKNEGESFKAKSD